MITPVATGVAEGGEVHMVLFVGTLYPRLDEKSRLVLPAKYRDHLASGIYLTKGQENCLVVYPSAVFEEEYDKLAHAPTTDKRVRDYLRVYLASAEPQLPDKQGRVTIPAPLRAYAGLNRDVAIIGQGRNLEIWDAPTWDAYLADQDPTFSATSAPIAGQP